MHLKDSPTGYGWISIVLHWGGAIAVGMLWFIGNTMTSPGTPEGERAVFVHMHTSIAVAAYPLLLARIGHRLTLGFPAPPEKEPLARFVLARLIQYTLLTAIAVMLVSGPLMVWAGGDAIGVFGWGAIASPLPPNEALHGLMAQTHRTARWVLLAGVLAHVGGVFLARSETLNRMLVARDPPPREE